MKSASSPCQNSQVVRLVNRNLEAIMDSGVKQPWNQCPGLLARQTVTVAKHWVMQAAPQDTRNQWPITYLRHRAERVTATVTSNCGVPYDTSVAYHLKCFQEHLQLVIDKSREIAPANRNREILEQMCS